MRQSEYEVCSFNSLRFSLIERFGDGCVPVSRAGVTESIVGELPLKQRPKRRAFAVFAICYLPSSQFDNVPRAHKFRHDTEIENAQISMKVVGRPDSRNSSKIAHTAREMAKKKLTRKGITSSNSFVHQRAQTFITKERCNNYYLDRSKKPIGRGIIPCRFMGRSFHVKPYMLKVTQLTLGSVFSRSSMPRVTWRTNKLMVDWLADEC
ncbi:hypothetical protein L210DRAFT_3053946 [Boletus edulis BED1]|uniref:Uncharacterized protein n=1 Tax=Boletus edulis BED1 TaxID=1328754 RepID=A0AAD4C088_BOLED|nr:hypothetical protein L210DRAFT_3053946 [Boletus edulis BED1]